MRAKRRSRKTQSTYHRQLRQMLERYKEETGNDTWQMIDAAKWAIANDLWKAPRYSPEKILARDMQQAARQEYIEDENGDPVRRKHPYRISSGDKYQTRWFNIEEATPDKVKISSSQRRNAIFADVVQAERDLRYYNKNYNTGEEIQMSWNFDADLSEKDQPTDYDDSPPTEEEA